MILNDPFGAFCRHTHVALAGSGHGPLQGQTMAVKVVFDIADHHTGNGHPPVAQDRPPAPRTASAVDSPAVLSMAGLAGLPRVILPLGTLDGCPLGLSLIAPLGCYCGLLDWIASHFD